MKRKLIALQLSLFGPPKRCYAWRRTFYFWRFGNFLLPVAAQQYRQMQMLTPETRSMEWVPRV